MKTAWRGKYNIFVIGFISLYFLFGMLTALLGAKEIFPFFSWSLFSFIPNENREYAIIVYEYDGIIVSPPQLFQQLFQEAKGIIRQSDSIIAHNLIQDFGNAYEGNEIRKAEKIRKLFNANFIKTPAQYSLIRIIYNPIERWKTGKYEFIKIREFMVGTHAL